MGLRNIFYKLANDVKKYPNIVQLTKTLDEGFKEVAEHINDGGSEVVVTPLLTSGEKIATITVDGDASDIYAPGLEYGTATDSFNTVNGSLVDELKVSMVPVQDLHGYSKPWAGRAGKNILPCTLTFLKSANTSGVWADNVYTISDLTITVTAVEDAVTKIDVNGTASARVNFIVGDSFTLTNGVSYTISGSTDGNVSDKWCIYVAYHGSNPSEMSANGAGTFTYVSGQAVTTTLVVFSGASPSHQPFYPMLRLASIADPTFEPYSNICPISGHTQVQSKINNTTYTTSLGGTYYGGDVDQVGGTGKSEWANIAAYAGETITKPWISSIDEYTPEGTPSTGAQVCYKLATPTALTLTGQNIVAEPGLNNVSAPMTGQSIEEVKYHTMMTIEDVIKITS